MNTEPPWPSQIKVHQDKVNDARGYPGEFAHSRKWPDSAGRREWHELPPSERNQRLVPTIANIAPCGSRQLAIQLPPGTCVGPWMIWPPPFVTRFIAASTASTLK